MSSLFESEKNTRMLRARVPLSLWSRFNVVRAEVGHSITQAIISAIELYIEHALEFLNKKNRKKQRRDIQ